MSRLSERLGRRTERDDTVRDDPAERSTVGLQPRAIPLAVAQAIYDTARAEWLDALRTSRDGRNRTLARLALAQKAYEEAGVALERARADDALERQRLEAVRRRREAIQRRVEAITNQAAAWDRVHDEAHEHARHDRGILGRLFGRRR